MAEVYPFIGTRYNSQLIGNLSKVISPPFDAISDDLQQQLHDRHENNAVRLEASREEGEDDRYSNRFTRAANVLGTWRSDGIFIEDERPSFYIYEQIFTDHAGEKHSRVGFYAKVKLEDQSIVSHESSSLHSGHRGERLDLIRTTKANIGAISAVFHDADGEVAEVLRAKTTERPWEDMTDEAGVQHRLWVLQKKDLLLKLVDAMKSAHLYVADGHQGYVTAQAYRDEMRLETGKADGKQPFDYTMMLLVPLQDSPLPVNARHRALTKSIMSDVDLKSALEELEDYFEISREKINLATASEEAARLEARLTAPADKQTSLILLHASGSAFVLTLKDDVDLAELYDTAELPECVAGMDVCVLHHYIINQVMIGNPEYELEDDECLYVNSATELLQLLHTKKAVCGFLMKPVSVQQMLDIAGNDALPPFDATILMPRPAVGLVLRNMQTDIVKIPRK